MRGVSEATAEHGNARPTGAAGERRAIGAGQHDPDPRRVDVVGGEVAPGLHAGDDDPLAAGEHAALDPGQRFGLGGVEPGLQSERMMDQGDPRPR